MSRGRRVADRGRRRLLSRPPELPRAAAGIAAAPGRAAGGGLRAGAVREPPAGPRPGSLRSDSPPPPRRALACVSAPPPAGCRTRSPSPSSSPRPPKTTARPPRRASLRGCTTAGTPSRCWRRQVGAVPSARSPARTPARPRHASPPRLAAAASRLDCVDFRAGEEGDVRGLGEPHPHCGTPSSPPRGQEVLQEFNSLKTANHPNIVKLLEVIHTPETLFTVMEYLSGGDLPTSLEARGRLTEGEARGAFRQPVSALRHCPPRGVVHPDVELSSLLLDANNNIKSSDFGLSNLWHPGKKLNPFCGSPAFTAPELYLGPGC
ncbi:uncharacterized protein ACBT57_000486 [Dama dama]